MKLLAEETIDYVDDNGAAWRFTLSSFSVLAHGMYEQMYLSTAFAWYQAALGITPDVVFAERRKRTATGLAHTKEQQYQVWLAERVFSWAAIAASIVKVEVQLDPSSPLLTEVEIPAYWRTPDGVLEGIKADLFSEMTVVTYRINGHLLGVADDDEKEKKRGVIRSPLSTNSSPTSSPAKPKKRTRKS